MNKLPLIFAYAASLFLIAGSIYAKDSTVAVVRDRYGGSLEYDTQYDRPDRIQQAPYGYGDRYGDYRYGNYQNRYAAPGYVNPGYANPAVPGAVPQYVPPPPPYGGTYYPPNADIDPDQTRFNMLYQHNVRTLGQ